MLISGITFILGVFSSAFLTKVPDTFWISWLPLVVWLAIVSRYLRYPAIFICGFLWACLFFHWQLQHRFQQAPHDNEVVVVGEVLDIPQQREYATRFVFQLTGINERSGKIPQKARLDWRRPAPALLPGQVWQLRLRLKPPHGYQNPGGFDYERWLFNRQIDATGYVVKSSDNQLLLESKTNIAQWRMQIGNYIDARCHGCEHIGLIQALSIGYRAKISSDQRSTLQNTGTAHLIAISGLHIGIIAGFCYLIASRIWGLLLVESGVEKHRFAIVIAWLGALAYCLLSGFDLPAQRALLMLSVVLVTAFFRLPLNLLHSVFLSLLIIVLISPLSVLSSSLWLTFSALMIIGLGQFLIPASLPVWKKLLGIQLLFSVLFIPLSILVFGQIHSASLLANLVAVPLLSFIVVPLNFLLLVLFWLPADWISYGYRMLDSILDWLLYFLNLLSQNGFHAIPVADLAPGVLLMIAVMLVLLLMPRVIRPAAPLFLVLPGLLIIYSKTVLTSVADGEFKAAALDVGTGSSVVVQTRNHTLVYDFGPGNDKGFSTAEWVLEPFLRSQGINSLQAIVISHTDQDHSGGFHAIQNRWQPDFAYAGMPIETNSMFSTKPPFMDCHDARDWWWDGVHFEFFRVEYGIRRSDNNRSCVLKVSNHGGSVLIPGDIESSAELNLIQRYAAQLKSDILIAPHHGSKSSSSPEFIQQVQPNHVVFQMGYMNRWRFPKPEIVKRYHESGVESFQTGNDGAILIDCGHLDCKVKSYRRLHPHPWY